MNAAKVFTMFGLVVFGIVFSTDASAMRCGTRLISKGDHISKILRYCGEPDYAQSRAAQRSYSDYYGRVLYTGLFEEVQIQEWTYNLGPNKLMRVIKMENGIVSEVRHLGYGYTAP